jgi:DNA-binding protein Fis
MVGGRVLISDSTHLKANANKRKLVREEVQQSTKSYLAELEEAVRQDRENHGKKL